jgi:glycogen(starch) synthase
LTERTGSRPATTWRGSSRAILFETSWEVCNKVGGIYQVLRSKAEVMVGAWSRRYCLVGPYVPAHAALEFERLRPAGWMGQVVRSLEEQGVVAHHGRWIVPGRPRVILLEHELSPERLDGVRHRLQHDHGIEWSPGDPLVDAAISFGEAVRMLFVTACRHWADDSDELRRKRDRRVLGHFHEWQGSLAIPLLRREGAPVATVFTTHATLLGRYIASSEEGFYDRLMSIDASAEAARYDVRTQHQIERACAKECGIFTTVSPITQEECTSLLGRTPDLITPNGLNIDRFDIGPDFHTMHAQQKEQIHHFTMGHFFPSYAFDLDQTLYFFTSGRFEPRNKGFDLCLESMARLNAELQAAKLGVTVVFFIVSQQPTQTLDPRALHARGVLDELWEVSQRIVEGVGERLFRRGAAGDRVRLDDLIEEYWLLRFRRTQYALQTDSLPQVVTHVLEDEEGDPVLNHIRHLGLCNREEDPVKVVYHPEFINPVNPLWGIEYEQFVRGCHLGIFPSVYEPWGYTPLECVAMGVPAVTSDLTGFGRYVAETHPDHDHWGVNLLARRGRSFDEAAADLTIKLFEFCHLDRRGRIALRHEVEQRAREFDWPKLVAAYHRAHDRALALRI